MLLEQLAAQAGQAPDYDWDAYYGWLFSQLAGREATGFRFWLCESCQAVNVVYLPARHATCRMCRVTRLKTDG